MSLSGPVLRIDEHGILWRRWSEQLIPSSEIEELCAFQVQRVRFVGLVLRDASRYPSKTLLGRLARANRFYTECDISIEVAGTDRRHDELLDAFDRAQPSRLDR